jgi:hypothetical protein
MKNLTLITLLLLSFTTQARSYNKAPHSSIDPVEVLSLCGNWNVQDWSDFERDVKDYGLRISDSYFDVECTYSDNNASSHPLFYRAVMDVSYRVDFIRLMRMFQKEGGNGNERLTCAVKHTTYRGKTILEHLQVSIDWAKKRLQTETDPDLIEAFNYGIKERKRMIKRMSKHANQYPVNDPVYTCPMLPSNIHPPKA